MAAFKVKGDKLFYNDFQTKIVSGAIHYFRTVPQYWEDRLTKLKACGFNTVETYVPWNLHEPSEGLFDFEGIADIEGFIKIAKDLDLFLILRPGPYICSEWDGGGLPSWLLNYPDLVIRCSNKVYLSKVEAYYDVLIPKLRPYLCSNGGPIIAMQIENEYGSYGSDKNYLNHLKEGLIQRGIDVLLFTSDGPDDLMLQGGHVDGALRTVNFGSKPKEAFDQLRKYQDGPPMCMEYWMGWFDHWGENHHTRHLDEVVDILDRMLRDNGHVNFYMFHGGTNFGFYNGSNYENGLICPTTTSYDFDGMLNEAGDMTEKYYCVKECLKNYMDSLEEPFYKLAMDDTIEVSDTEKVDYGQIHMTQMVSLFSQKDQLSHAISHVTPLSMEKCNQDYGYIMYKSSIEGNKGQLTLTMDVCHDRALVYLDGHYRGKYDRSMKENEEITLEIESDRSELIILVENLGRINYGDKILDPKGMIGNVRLNYQYLYDWMMYPLQLNNLEAIKEWKLVEELKNFTQVPFKSPMIFKGNFYCHEVGDTYLNMAGWLKGNVFVNGHNLGRYWSNGPQSCLYVPAPYLHEGQNEIMIFELEGCKELYVRSQKKQEWIN